MRKDGHSIALAAGLIATVALVAAGCIAVSREVRHLPPTSGADNDVTGGGRWEVDQAWQCRDAEALVLEDERADLRRTIAAWLDDGWELDEFDVVRLPGTSDRREELCLVGTFRRWVAP